MTVLSDTIDAVHEAVKIFATAQSIACAYPNAVFTPPRSATNVALPWMRLGFPEGDIGIEQIYATSRPTFRGFFALSFFVPHDVGTATLRSLTDAALATFKAGTAIGPAVVLRHVVRHAPNPAELWDRAPNEWDVVTVSIFFRAQ